MTNKVLQAILEMTQQREQDDLGRFLLCALSEAIDNSAVLLYRVDAMYETDVESFVCAVLSRNNENHVVHEIDNQDLIPEPVKRCKHEGKPIEMAEEGSHLYFLPVIGNDRVIAVVELQSDMISDNDKKAIHDICGVYENFLEVINESTRDTLTGLLNRRTFETRINKRIATYHQELEEDNKQNKERRNKGDTLPHWLAVIDIDHFKRINDNFGHVYGDEVLLLLSHVMKGFFRKTDLIYRFGGEEFVVVIRPASKEDALNLFNRFRQRIAEYAFPQVERVTVSTGIAQINKHDFPSSVLDIADKALYYAKENGRNLVACYEDLVAEGKLEKSEDTGDVELF